MAGHLAVVHYVHVIHQIMDVRMPRAAIGTVHISSNKACN